jgi:FkbM family methyltransferase
MNHKSYSQYGEDVKIWEFFNYSKSGFFIEAGANHPTKLSQTYLLEKNGWTGILVEPVPECCELLRAQRSSKVFEKALGSSEQRGALKILIPGGSTELASAYFEENQLTQSDRVIETEVVTLDDLLCECGVETVDFISLDMEGMEIDALKGFPFERYRPAFILIEDRNENLKKHRFLKQKKYKLVYRMGSNNWYVPKEKTYPVNLITKAKLIRKLYISIPFRKIRDILRCARGKNGRRKIN